MSVLDLFTTSAASVLLMLGEKREIGRASCRERVY